MLARHFFRQNWPAITIAVTAAAIACAALVMLGNMPPRSIIMATGPEGGTRDVLGERYRAALARSNVELQLVRTAGSVENLAKLLDPRGGADVALIEGGISSAKDASGLESLGVVFYEPLWWFQRRDIPNTGFVDSLRGRKVSIGHEGSGTRALSLELIKQNGLEGQFGELLGLAPQEARDKLLTGDIDVAFIMMSWASPIVQQLLADERVTFSGYARADAFVALYPFINKVVVPRGVTDLARDRPPVDRILIATKASLVVRKDLHPALEYLLLDAAVRIHSGANIFHRANVFPAAEAIDIPLSTEALRFYKSGPPFLHEYFPFWMAVLVGKLIILLIPILGVLYPMIRFLPRLYEWVMRSKVLRMYGELRMLEDEMMIARSSGRDMHEMVARLDRLEQQANRLKLPYGNMLYMLRDHIGGVRAGLQNNTEKDALLAMPQDDGEFVRLKAKPRGVEF